MMIPAYTAAGLAWLAAAIGATWWAGATGRRQTWLALGAFLLFTVVFDAILTGLPIVTYDGAAISGIRLGTTPVEDYLYGAALCLTAIAAYDAARGRRRQARSARPPR
jgi:lycopene cyclase domain-containing protein